MPGHVSWQLAVSALLASAIALGLAVLSIVWIAEVWDGWPWVKYSIFLALLGGYGWAWFWLVDRIYRLFGGDGLDLWP